MRSRNNIFIDCFSLSRNRNWFSSSTKCSGFERNTRDRIGFIEARSDELTAAKVVFFGVFFGSVGGFGSFGLLFGGFEMGQVVFELSDFFLFYGKGFVIGEKNVGFIVKFEDFLFDLFYPTI